MIDSKEPTIWDKRFTKEGFEVERKTLDIGDFIVDNICFERKSTSDFCESIISGHLQKQLIQQENSYNHSFLLITGCWKDFARFGKRFSTKNYVTGFLAHLRNYRNTIIIPVEQETYVPLVIKKIVLKIDKELSIKDTELLKSTIDTDFMELKLLNVFEGVGIKKAEKLLKNQEIKWEVDSFLAKMKEFGVSKCNYIDGNQKPLPNGKEKKKE